MRCRVASHLKARLLRLLLLRLLLLRLLLWRKLLSLVGRNLLLLLLLGHLLLVLLLRVLVQQAVQGLRALRLRELLQARALQGGQPGHQLPQQLLLHGVRLHDSAISMPRATTGGAHGCKSRTRRLVNASDIIRLILS